MEPAADLRSGLGRESGEQLGDYAAAYVRQGQRVLLPHGTLNVPREPEQGVPVGSGDSDPESMSQEEPLEFVEGQLVTLADLFSESSASVD